MGETTSRRHRFIIAIAWLTKHQTLAFSSGATRSPLRRKNDPLTIRNDILSSSSLWLSSLHMIASTNGKRLEGDDIIPSSLSSPTITSTNIADGSTNNKEMDDKSPEMPWSEAQEWALLDNLPKYVIFIGTRRYARWRALTREVPELAGYPGPFLRRMHRLGRSISEEDEDGAGTLGILPMLDDFEFSLEGGIVGKIYGLPGVADGSRIQTSVLVQAERTVPFGYVTALNDDGAGLSYELGTMMKTSSPSNSSPSNSSPSSEYSLVETAMGASLVPRQIADVTKGVMETGSSLLSDDEANRDLAYIGGTTAVVLALASAVGALSHHLTVNVFWV